MMRLRLALLALAVAGGWVPVAIASGETVAVRMADLANGRSWTSAYSLLIAAGWAVSLLALPGFGWCSDRLVARGIGRRALIAAGVLAMIGTAFLLMSASSIPAFSAAWILAQLPTALIVSVSSARLIDETPDTLKGWTSGIAGMAPAAAILIGAATVLLTHQSVATSLLVPALVGVLLVLPSLAFASQPRSQSPATDAPRARIATMGWLLGIVTLAFSGLAVGRIYVIPLVQSVTVDAGATALANASTTVLIATITALIGSAIVGRISKGSDRARGVFAWLAASATIPLLALAAAGTLSAIYLCAALLGLIIGGLNAATYAVYLKRYASDLTHGQDLGLIAAAETVPYVLVPLVAAIPQLLTGESLLRPMFIAGAIAAAAAAAGTWIWQRRTNPRSRE